MAPLITIFGFAYFCLVFLINRYNLIYVNEQRWQGGGTRLSHFLISFRMQMCACVLRHLTRAWFLGTMWSIVYHLFMAAILLFQLIMLGILGTT